MRFLASIILVIVLLCCPAFAEQQKSLMLATTTSAADTGFLDYFLVSLVNWSSPRRSAIKQVPARVKLRRLSCSCGKAAAPLGHMDGRRRRGRVAEGGGLLNRYTV